MDLPQRDGERLRFGLTEDVRRVRRGPAAQAGGCVETAVELSRPQITPLTADLIDGDKELAAFWAAEKARYRYDYVTFRVGFSPRGQLIRRAWVEILLESEAADGPIAWSMSPELSASEKVTEKASLKGEFKLFSGEAESTREQQLTRWVLRSRMTNPSKPYWEFAATDAIPLDGDFKLHLVLRTPSPQTARGVVTARVDIAGRSFLLFQVGAPSEQRAGASFELTPPPLSAALAGTPSP